MKSIRKGFGVAATAGLILLVAAAPALAHPKVVSRTPENGSTVDQPPSEVEVEFDEIVENANLDVFDPCGEQVDDGNPEVLAYTVSVGMSADKAGTYTVQWEVISRDTHNVSGSWTFTSSGGSACPGSGGGDKDPGGTGGDQPGGGGSNGNGGNTSTSGGSGGDSTGGTSNDPNSTSGGAGKNGGKHQGHNDKGKGNDKKSKHHHPSTDEPREVDLVAGGDEGGSSDIPVDWLLISFGIAALIGAAGGSIYASIVGPR